MEDSGADRLPGQLTPLGDYLLIDLLDDPVEAPTNDDWFALSVDVPTDVTPEEMVLAVWMPADWPFVSDPVGDHGYWEVVDGEIDAGRFVSRFYILPHEPLIAVFAHGPWFDPHKAGSSSASDEGEDVDQAEISQELTNSSFRVKCEKNDPDVCTTSQRAELAVHLQETMTFFAGLSAGQYSFADPHIRKIGSGSDDDFVVYMRMMRSTDETSGACRYGPGDVNTGRYNRFFRKLTVCIWPTDRAAPTIRIGPGVGTIPTTYTISFENPDGSTNSVQTDVQANDTAAAVASRLAEKLRDDDNQLNPAPVGLSRLSPAEAFDNKISINFRGYRDDVPTFSVDVTSEPDAIALIDFEYRLFHTATHEYFHALQHGAMGMTTILSEDKNRFYKEGAAVASERMRYPTTACDEDDEDCVEEFLGSRNTRRSFRDLNRRSIRDNNLDHSYSAQDYFLSTGRLLGKGIEWVIPMMESRGSQEAHAMTLSAFGVSLREAHWAYVRNMAVEKQFPLDELRDEWNEPCEFSTGLFADLVTHPDLTKEVDYTGGTQTVSFPAAMFRASYLKINFPSSFSDQAFVVEANPLDYPSSTLVGVYRDRRDYSADDSCVIHGLGESRNVEVINVGFENEADHVFVLASGFNPVQDTVEVTIRPLDTAMALSHSDGDIAIAGRPLTLSGDYEVESAPAYVRWFVDSFDFASSTHSQLTGEVTGYLTETCPPGSKAIRAELTGDDESFAYDEVEIDFVFSGTQLGMDVSDATACGSSYDLLVSDGEIPSLSIIASHLGCEAQPSAYGWNWTISEADGTVREVSCTIGSNCRLLVLTEDDFRDGSSFGPVSLGLSHDDLDGTVSKTIRPCDHFGSSGLPVCIDPSSCDGPGAMVGLSPEIAWLRDHSAIVMTLDDRISNALHDLVPEDFPLPPDDLITELKMHLPAELVTALRDLNHALDAQSVEEFSRDLSAVRAQTSRFSRPEEAVFLNSVIALIEVNLSHFLDFNRGGQGGWFDFSFFDKWRQGVLDPLEPARWAIAYSLHTWLDAFQRNEVISLHGGPVPLDDPDVWERASVTSTQGPVRQLIDRHFE